MCVWVKGSGVVWLVLMVCVCGWSGGDMLGTGVVIDHWLGVVVVGCVVWEVVGVVWVVWGGG